MPATHSLPRSALRWLGDGLDVASVVLGVTGWVFILPSAALVLCALNRPVESAPSAEHHELRRSSAIALGGSVVLITASVAAGRTVRRVRRIEEARCLRLALEDGAVRPARLAAILGVTRDEAAATLAHLARERSPGFELDVDDDGLHARPRREPRG